MFVMAWWINLASFGEGSYARLKARLINQCPVLVPDMALSRKKLYCLDEKIDQLLVHIVVPEKSMRMPAPRRQWNRTYSFKFSALLRSARAAAQPWNLIYEKSYEWTVYGVKEQGKHIFVDFVIAFGGKWLLWYDVDNFIKLIPSRRVRGESA
jgi:hypothetical protein